MSCCIFLFALKGQIPKESFLKQAQNQIANSVQIGIETCPILFGTTVASLREFNMIALKGQP